MIVKMSKVQIVGPKGFLQDLLSILEESGKFQIEPANVGLIGGGYEGNIRSFLLDEKTLAERLFLEDLKEKIEELFSYLPEIEVRKSYIEPLSVIDIIDDTIRGHIGTCRDMYQRKDALLKELAEIRRYPLVLDTLSSLLGEAKDAPDLDFIGLTIKDPAQVERIRELISRITEGRSDLITETAVDGTIVGLIIVERDFGERIRKSLSDERFPEMPFPSSFEGLTLQEKVAYLKRRVTETSAGIEEIDRQMELFTKRWKPVYGRVKEWITDRLSLLKTTAAVFETRMCFCIYGWMPFDKVEALRQRLSESFGEKVVLDEKEMKEEDTERVPVILRNPPYFRPFELLARLLPLPRYTSFDPTPFIAIFFPLFFGMILGDAGYGLALLIIALFMMNRFKARGKVMDVAKILLVCSLYSIIAGIIYGEFLGELGHRVFGLKPLLVERRTAIMPMVYFALTVGLAHISIGIFLGFISALRKDAKKEALNRLSELLVILGITALGISLVKSFPHQLVWPVALATTLLILLYMLTGGVLAPFELMKSIGNIVSYVRIMAVGLASVFLATVANDLAGMTGNVVIGIIIAALLHAMNMVLGIFSPAVHSLRLHYVEFFGKFLEHGGRRFKPLKKGT
jgi:V/A-type H+/Na+-transporting ATPase subunit I